MTNARRCLVCLSMALVLWATWAPFSHAESLATQSATQTYRIGDVVKTGTDTGYKGSEPIGEKDPHYNWTLGDFYLSGYTRQSTDDQGNLVFLKNVGDRVALSFVLAQDIDKLNGNDKLMLSGDKNGYDAYFQTERTDAGRGLLVIRKTDYQNNKTTIGPYVNYLSGVEVGANTAVELFEEGDYEVALDYEIDKSHIDVFGLEPLHTFTNYRIFFTFSIRNSNCMVYPFAYPATEAPVELRDYADTPQGFYLDLARSRYLNIQVQREILTQGANGYVKDMRYNRAAVDGEVYTDAGIYTIEVSNRYTNQKTTLTLFVVGDDPVLKAYIQAGYSLEALNAEWSAGYARGTLPVWAQGTPPSGDGAQAVQLSMGGASTAGTLAADDEAALPTPEAAPPAVWVVIVIVAGVLALGTVAGMLLWRKRKDKKQ